jgi:hypothetical protein
MKTRREDFPGTDSETSERLKLEVASDEAAMIDALLKLRQSKSLSLEAIGFLLGADPSQISRYLRGNSKVTLTNYLRIARAFGYRCKIVFEQTEAVESGDTILSNLRITSHKVGNARRTPTS